MNKQTNMNKPNLARYALSRALIAQNKHEEAKTEMNKAFEIQTRLGDPNLQIYQELQSRLGKKK